MGVTATANDLEMMMRICMTILLLMNSSAMACHVLALLLMLAPMDSLVNGGLTSILSWMLQVMRAMVAAVFHSAANRLLLILGKIFNDITAIPSNGTSGISLN